MSLKLDTTVNIYWNKSKDSDEIIGAESFYLTNFVELHDQELRSKYLAFICNLGNFNINGKRIVKHMEVVPNFSFWWMTTLAEKSFYKSPYIKDCLKLLALEKIITNANNNSFIIHGVNNKNVRKSIQRLFGKLKLNVEILFNDNER